MRYVIKPIYNELGFDEKDNESHVQLMHRARVIQHACFYNYVYCTNRAQLLFRDWMSERTKNLYAHSSFATVALISLRRTWLDRSKMPSLHLFQQD